MLIWVLIMMFSSSHFNDFKCYKSRALIILLSRARDGQTVTHNIILLCDQRTPNRPRVFLIFTNTGRFLRDIDLPVWYTVRAPYPPWFTTPDMISGSGRYIYSTHCHRINVIVPRLTGAAVNILWSNTIMNCVNADTNWKFEACGVVVPVIILCSLILFSDTILIISLNILRILKLNSHHFIQLLQNNCRSRSHTRVVVK